MPNLALASVALYRMAQLLDVAELQSPADRGGRGRYERATSDYQDSLISAYQRWGKNLQKQLTGDLDADSQLISAGMPALRLDLQRLGQSEFPTAFDAMSADYIPSADAWRMVSDAIQQNSADIDRRLIPEIESKLARGLVEDADMAGVLQSLEPRVSIYAGNFWALIMHAVGDYAQQAKTFDDLIYPCKWVLDPQADHCEACPIYAGTYDSYDDMLKTTGGSVPGYFAGSPYRSCWGNCRCHLQLRINGAWQRV